MDRLERDVGAVRVVVLALAGGVVVFTGIAMVLARPGAELVRAIGMALALVVPGAVALWLVLRASLLARLAARGADPAEGMPPELRTLAIVGAAACEAPALLGTLGYLLTARWPFLLAPALGVVLILAQLPSARGVRERLDALRRHRA